MKSTSEDLKRRGYIENTDVLKYEGLDYNELICLLKSGNAFIRSIAVRVLSEKYFSAHSELAEILLEVLSKEKSLYTKIEICRALEKGDIQTARAMIPYLGTIGNSQYKELPTTVSKKKSYPLPRDIIARTLGNMNISILPVLVSILEDGSLEIIREAIDAIGYLCFYNTVENEDSFVRDLYSSIKVYLDDSIVRWKAAVCLSAFKCETSIQLLNNLSSKDNEPVIRNEAIRSLRIIGYR
ncbi:MAG: HEAT repeat domain-containing protein [Bacillota bacterium]|nr:HEAT repeat domain-containing protein [Bacillota bacterium]